MIGDSMKKVLDHNCPNCDAVLKFNPKHQNWKCEHCRKEYTLDFLEKVLDPLNVGDKDKLPHEENYIDVFL